MSTTQITVKQVWKPFKPTDKRTNVDDTNGGKWRIDVAKTSALAPGCLYEIDYTEESFNGRSFNLIGRISQLAGSLENEKSNKVQKDINGPERGGIFHDVVPLLAAGRSIVEVVKIMKDANEVYAILKGWKEPPKAHSLDIVPWEPSSDYAAQEFDGEFED